MGSSRLESRLEVADWNAISTEFENLWNFPHCVGAIDGKHVATECPKLSGTKYLDYKVSLVWYFSRFAMQNMVLFMLTLVS